MARKFALLGITVVAATSLAIPTLASASPELRDSSGKVGFGNVIRLASTNLKVTNTALGTLSCKQWGFRAVVTANSGSFVTAQGVSGETATCEASGLQLNVTEPTLISMETLGTDFGIAWVGFIADVGPFECVFSDKGDFSFETGEGRDTIHIPGIWLGSSEICEPEEGITTFEGDFTLTTSASGSPTWFQ